MSKEAKDKDFIRKPQYVGGPKAMRKFIGEHLRYPLDALEKKVEGTVYVHFDINHKGQVAEAKVVSGIGHGCDEEALRLVTLLRFEVPTNRGVRVVFHKNIQIHFRLPKAKEQPATAQFLYVTTAAPPPSDKPKKPPTTYTITLGG